MLQEYFNERGLDLLGSKPMNLTIAFTTNCTLRCTYCAVSQPYYQGRTLHIDDVDNLIAELKSLSLKVVGISGHGETTMIPEWEKTAQKFVDSGFSVTLGTNFAREMTSEEVNVLAKMANINVSIDTVDRKLFREIRRAGDLRTVFLNIIAVRAQAILLGIPGPRFVWNCVVSDAVVHDLPRWVASGIALGAKGFHLLNLIKYPDVKDGGRNVRHPSTLLASEAHTALRAIETARKLALSKGAAFIAQASLEESLKEAIKTSDSLETSERVSSFVSEISTENEIFPVNRISVQPGQGETRDCLDPWFWSNIDGGGEIRLCCCCDRDNGKLGESSFSDLLNGPRARELRRSLLSGELDSTCKSCSVRGITTKAALKKKVEEFLEGKNLTPWKKI